MHIIVRHWFWKNGGYDWTTAYTILSLSPLSDRQERMDGTGDWRRIIRCNKGPWVSQVATKMAWSQRMDGDIDDVELGPKQPNPPPSEKMTTTLNKYQYASTMAYTL